MDRYIDSIKESISNIDMQYSKVFIHPEEYGNDKINTAITTGMKDIIAIDNKTKAIASSTRELLEKTTKRLDVVLDVINAEKERLQDIVMLCNSKTDFDNAIILSDEYFTGEFEYSDGVFSCKSSNSTNVTSQVESVEGNGYVGNKYVTGLNGYQEKTISTAHFEALLDNNVSTYWEYSRITASSTEEYLISDFHTDDAEANCTITFKLSTAANELMLYSNLNSTKVVNVRYSNDGIKYKDLNILPFTINQKDESYKNQGYIYGSNIIAFPKSNYVKVTFQSTGYMNEVIAFERTITEDNSEKISTQTTIVPTAKRHVVRLNDAVFKEKKYSTNSSFKSKELINADSNIFAISIFANTYIPEGLSNESIKFILTVNGNDYEVIPVNSNTNGIKIVRFSQGKIPNQYTQYIGEQIKSAFLTVQMKAKNNVTPYINNLKILLGDEI